jgi:hypothetical protein
MNIVGFFDSVGRDLRHALRGLMRRPTFTLAAVFTLALGIGATTAIFSVVYSVLIKPLPYSNADELVSVSHAAPGVNINDGLGEDPPMYFTYDAENRTFASLGLWQQGSMTLAGGGSRRRRRSDPRPKGSSLSFFLMRSGRNDLAVAKRCSGGNSRSTRSRRRWWASCRGDSGSSI